MRHQRLLVLCALIAAASVWLYLALPRAPVARTPAAPTPAHVHAPKPAPTPREVVEQAPAEAPPALPPTVPVAPLVVPPGDEPPHAEAVPAEQETVVEEEPPKAPPIDADRAADLFADLLAKQEAEPEKDRLPDTARELWKRFDQEKPDETWSATATPKLQGSLEEWIDALPEGAGDHLALVHVECRASLCQVLAADNDLAGQSARAEGGREWQQAVAGLRGQSWWGDAGFTDMTTQVVTQDGYVLYTTYLLRGSGAP